MQILRQRWFTHPWKHTVSHLSHPHRCTIYWQYLQPLCRSTTCRLLTHCKRSCADPHNQQHQRSRPRKRLREAGGGDLRPDRPYEVCDSYGCPIDPRPPRPDACRRVPGLHLDGSHCPLACPLRHHKCAPRAACLRVFVLACFCDASLRAVARPCVASEAASRDCIRSQLSVMIVGRVSRVLSSDWIGDAVTVTCASDAVTIACHLHCPTSAERRLLSRCGHLASSQGLAARRHQQEKAPASLVSTTPAP